MEREWFETRRRSVNRLQVATLVMMCVFFVCYFMARAGHSTYAGPLGWATFIAFAGLGIKRQSMVAEYNARILARDPKLVDEFVPIVR